MKFKNQEAQKWWVYKSLKEFKIKLSKLNINLQIIKPMITNLFFESLFKKKIFQFIGIKHMNLIIFNLIITLQKKL